MAGDEKALDHAWGYFALHANQRITVFNYFVVFAGVLTTGIAAAVQASREMASVGIALGLLLVLLSFVFWKLDQRTSFLIKHAEDVIRQLEPASASLLGTEGAKTQVAKRDERLWTYGRAFRTIFLVMALVGIAGTLLAGARATGLINLRAEAETTKGAAAPITEGATPLPPHASDSRCSVRMPTRRCDKRTSNEGGPLERPTGSSAGPSSNPKPEPEG